MPAKFEIYKDKKGEFRFRLKAANGQPILASEGYSTKPACKNGIASVQKNCADDACFETRQAKNGKPFFVLKARNKQVIGSSQMYSSSSSMRAGIRSVKTNGGTTNVTDLTV